MVLDPQELTREEDLALMGLLKAMIQADKSMSLEEREELKRVKQALGAKRFHERVEESKALFFTLSDIKRYALKVERQDARQLIFNLVEEMAKQGDLGEEEQDLLSWLAGAWEVEYFRR